LWRLLLGTRTQAGEWRRKKGIQNAKEKKVGLMLGYRKVEEKRMEKERKGGRKEGGTPPNTGGNSLKKKRGKRGRGGSHKPRTDPKAQGESEAGNAVKGGGGGVSGRKTCDGGLKNPGAGECAACYQKANGWAGGEGHR